MPTKHKSHGALELQGVFLTTRLTPNDAVQPISPTPATMLSRTLQHCMHGTRVPSRLSELGMKMKMVVTDFR